MENTSGPGQPVAYKVAGVYSGLFIYIGIAMPFWALWLAKVGMSPGEIGFLIGFPSFLKIVSSPFIAQLCDKWGMVRRPMMALLALSMLFFAGYFIFSGFSAFVVVTLLFSLVYFAVMPLMESYAVRVCDKYGLQYGRLRAAGSVVFVFTSILFGKYLDHFGYGNFLYFCLGSMVMTFFAIYLLPRERIKSKPHDIIQAQGDISPLKFLVSSREFIMFLVVISLIQMSHGFIYVMGSYHWSAQGIDNGTIGGLWSIGVIAEIGVFIFAGRFINHIRPMYMLMIIALFGVIRWLTLATTISLPLLFLVQTFHGLTYGACHLVAMYYMSSRVPVQYIMTAQSLYSSVPMGLSMGVIMIISGPLYSYFGGNAYYLMAGLCFMVLFIAKFVRRIDNTVGADK